MTAASRTSARAGGVWREISSSSLMRARRRRINLCQVLIDSFRARAFAVEPFSHK